MSWAATALPLAFMCVSSGHQSKRPEGSNWIREARRRPGTRSRKSMPLASAISRINVRRGDGGEALVVEGGSASGA